MIYFERTDYFNNFILPKIDSLTRTHSCSRSDIIRAILSIQLHELLPQKNNTEIEKIYSVESEASTPNCIVVYLDSHFDQIIQRKRTKAIDIVCRYLGVIPEPEQSVLPIQAPALQHPPIQGRVVAAKR